METVNTDSRIAFRELSHEDKQKLVDTFAWLIREDKKQNPELYKLKKQEND